MTERLSLSLSCIAGGFFTSGAARMILLKSHFLNDTMKELIKDRNDEREQGDLCGEWKVLGIGCREGYTNAHM